MNLFKNSYHSDKQLDTKETNSPAKELEIERDDLDDENVNDEDEDDDEDDEENEVESVYKIPKFIF